MLHELHIENLAIIERADIAFAPGFNVLTGETGAGKSILISALNLVLGERADATLIRTGAERLRVSAIFQLPDEPELHATLNTLGIEPEDGLLYLAREVQASGRSIARVNAQPVPLGTLKAIGDLLVDLHGQHEHQLLLKPGSHLDFLDRWLGEETLQLRAEVRETLRQLHQLESELKSLVEREREREQMIDLYRFQREEIQKAHLQPGEEESLLTEERRLTHAERLLTLAHAAYECLMGEGGAYDRAAEAARHLQDIIRIDPSVADWQEPLEGAVAQLEESARLLRHYAENIEYDPERLEEVIARLELIRRLKRKYGDTIEAILAYAEELESKLHALEHQTERREELEQVLEATRAHAHALSEQLSARRRAGAAQFAAQVLQHLQELAMERAQFIVNCTPKPMDSTGIDAVEFLFSANPGEPPRPLHKIASGGELSRLMLALKTVLATASPVPTLVFDEIDVGLGGRTAHYIGEKLAQLSQHFQIICVTHLPQIASRAHHHLLIEKVAEGETTHVVVTPLAGEQRVREIARMLTGEPTETALQHARELLESAFPSGV
jgi:DNA repair protein RecN (Recombination protein N)